MLDSSIMRQRVVMCYAVGLVKTYVAAMEVSVSESK